MIYENFEVENEKMEAARAAREACREEAYEKAEPIIGADGVEALREFMTLYDERLYFWAANLWDTERGGFYYSNSARDTNGFLPDIESTVQMMRFIYNSGLYEGRGECYGDSTPDFMKEKLVEFAQSLIDPDDGYAYHPQWGYNITVSRRGRDLNWTTSLLSQFGVEPKHKTAYQRIEEANSDKSDGSMVGGTPLLPNHLLSTEAFEKYLSDFESPGSTHYVGRSTYSLGNYIQSQSRQIKSAGEEYVTILADWYAKLQREDNGLFEESICYNSTNGLMKILLTFTSLKKPFPNAVKALESTIAVTGGDESPGWVCCYYNPWITIFNLLNNIRRFDDEKKAEELQSIVQKNAAKLIKNTFEKSKLFKKRDGAFSYYPETSTASSQSAPVAPERFPEGDVNATTLAATGTLINMCKALGIKPIPIFCREDGEIFLDLIKNARPIAKIKPIPEKLINRSKERQQ